MSDRFCLPVRAASVALAVLGLSGAVSADEADAVSRRLKPHGQVVSRYLPATEIRAAQPTTPQATVVPNTTTQELPVTVHQGLLISPADFQGGTTEDPIRKLYEPVRITSDGNNPTGTSPSTSRSSDDHSPKKFVAPFMTPAHFPLPDFGKFGELRSQDALVIHEGMSVTASASGHYEVRLVVEAPNVPVALRLQLQICRKTTAGVLIHTPATHPGDNEYGNPLHGTFQQSAVSATQVVGTITLPTIYLDVDAMDDANNDEDPIKRKVWLVKQHGTSYALRSLLQSPTGFEDCRFLRNGTARFGSRPEE